MAAAKKPKGWPTDLNVFAMASLFSGRDEIPNRVHAVDAPSVRKCIAAGFIAADRSTLRLTPYGIGAIEDYAASSPNRVSGPDRGARWRIGRTRTGACSIHEDCRQNVELGQACLQQRTAGAEAKQPARPPSREDEARVLRLIEAGPAHSLATAILSPADMRAAGALVSRGLVRGMPVRGRWPARYVVTAGGSHELGTFDSDDRSFRDDSIDAGNAARRDRAARRKAIDDRSAVFNKYQLDAGREARAAKPAGYGSADAKKKGQLRMFNPPAKIPRGKWAPFLVAGKPSPLVKKATDLASGAYAIRRKDSGGVVYVGESHTGHMWRTINRHFQAPASLLSTGNAFATDRPEDYEVLWKVSSRGKRARAKSDERAMGLQARWIEAFRKAGHRLHNRDDGMAEDTGPVNAPADDDPWGGLLSASNPRAPLVELGRLTGLDSAQGPRRWALRDAPVLAVDDAGKCFIVYVGRVVAPSSAIDRTKYSKLHWGAEGEGNVRDGRMAPPPYALGPAGTVITYTTRKGGDGANVDYVHAWGEGGRGKFVAPRIVMHSCQRCGPRCASKGMLQIVGGSYAVVPSRGIVG